MTSRVPVSVRLARAVHRRLLVLVDRGVRSAYRAEMLATFEAASAEAGRRGAAAVCALLLREIADLATARRANRPAGVPYPPQARRRPPAGPGSRSQPGGRRGGRSAAAPHSWLPPC